MTVKQVIERLRVMMCHCEDQEEIDTLWAAIRILEKLK